MRDAWEVIQLPLALALLAALITWLVWHYTATPCAGLARVLNSCNPSVAARFIDSGVWAGMLPHGAVGAGAGGVYNFAMISRERRRADDLERLLREERADREQGRRQAEAERQRLVDRILELTKPARDQDREQTGGE